MAVQTIYLLGTVGVTPNFWGNTQLNGSAPTAANSAFGWKPAKIATTTPFFRARLGATAVSGTAAIASPGYLQNATGPTPGTGSGSTTAGDSFIVGPFSGTFANTNWTFNFNLRAGTAGAIGSLNMRVWRSVNADGSSPTSFITWLQGRQVTLSTTADVNCVFTTGPSLVTLNAAYLFIQLEWQETTAGTSNNNDVLFRIGTASITTSDFAAAVTATLSATQANQTVSAVVGSIVDGDLIRPQAAQTFVGAADPDVGGTLNLLEISDTFVGAADPDVGGALNLLEISDTFVGVGAAIVGGTLNLSEIPDTLFGLAEIVMDIVGIVSPINLYGNIASPPPYVVDQSSTYV